MSKKAQIGESLKWPLPSIPQTTPTHPLSRWRMWKTGLSSTMRPLAKLRPFGTAWTSTHRMRTK